MLRSSWVMLAAALLLGAGCKSAGMSRASASYGYDGSYGDMEATESAVMEAPPPAEPVPAVTMDGIEAREYRDMPARSEMATPKKAPAPTGAAGVPGGGEGASGGQPQPADEKPKADIDGRHIVYTAMMTISVFNVEDARKTVEALPETYGGYLQSMNGDSLILRIPSKNLRKAMEDLEKLGSVEHRMLQTQDVTAEYVDIESRIRVLEETQKQLIDLLAKARTVEEALKVRTALDQVTMDLEVLKGRMRQLQNLVSYSTLTVQLTERGPHNPTPSENDPFPWVDELGVEATEWK